MCLFVVNVTFCDIQLTVSLPNSLGTTQLPLTGLSPLGILPAPQALHSIFCSQIFQDPPDHVRADIWNAVPAGLVVSASLPGGTISLMRWRISSEVRWGGRRLKRPEMAFTCRFIPVSLITRWPG